jgi:4'-phosphopantetheinyl transferase
MMRLFALPNSHDLQPALYDMLLNCVSDLRKQRVKKFVRREDACRSILGEVLAKYSVAGAAGIPADTVTFTVDSFGKPHMNREIPIHFNVSHSGSWVMCAVDNAPIGIDVEKVRHYDPDLAKRFYHPYEYDSLIALPEHERNGRFYDLWTIKESYIKALGKGLSIPLNSFEILFDNEQIRMDTKTDNPVMHFWQYDVGPNYRCAVCASHEDFPRAIEIITPQQLLTHVISEQA